MKSLENIARQAAITSTSEFTHSLRVHLSAHGWHPDVVNNVSVAHDNGSFKVHIHPDYADRAFVHEYGNEANRPTAAIRRFTEGMDATYMAHFNAHFGGK